MSGRRLFLHFAWALFFSTALLRAQDEVFERIEVRVTAVVGNNIYLDAGRSAGLERGDTLTLYPFAGAALQATVRATSKSSSRAELDRPGLPGTTVQIGDRGEVLVPAGRLAATAEEPVAPPVEGTPETVPREPRATDPRQEPEPDVPEHPPWEAPPEGWDQNMPLLAPVSGREPEDREPSMRGRAWTRYLMTQDDESGSREYDSWRAGVDVQYTNPFGRGGGLDFDVEYSHRTSDVEGGDDDTDSNLRVDRLSYYWGGIRGVPERWEVGRFLSSEFPELGVLDGVEYSVRRNSGDVYGASLGFLPEPYDDFETGEDFQASAFYRWVNGPEEDVSLGAAFQKTWNKGAADRDLMVATGDWRASDRTSVHGTAWIDFYSSNDEDKSSGPELTQLSVNATHRFDGGDGLGVFLSHVKWPSLERNELPDLSTDAVPDFEVTRVGVNGWKSLSDKIRLSGRLGRWEDEDDTGGGGEVRIDLRDVLYDKGGVSLALFDTEGSFSSGLGWRVSADRRLPKGILSLTWQSTDYEQEGFDGAQEDLLHQVLRAAYDTRLGDDWDFSIFAEDRFGDEQDSKTIGLFLQRRF